MLMYYGAREGGEDFEGGGKDDERRERRPLSPSLANPLRGLGSPDPLWLGSSFADERAVLAISRVVVSVVRVRLFRLLTATSGLALGRRCRGRVEVELEAGLGSLRDLWGRRR